MVSTVVKVTQTSTYRMRNPKAMYRKRIILASTISVDPDFAEAFVVNPLQSFTTRACVDRLPHHQLTRA